MPDGCGQTAPARSLVEIQTNSAAQWSELGVHLLPWATLGPSRSQRLWREARIHHHHQADSSGDELKLRNGFGIRTVYASAPYRRPGFDRAPPRIWAILTDGAFALTLPPLPCAGSAGGVFRITDGLQRRHGQKRCFDTPISESGIISAAIGMGVGGLGLRRLGGGRRRCCRQNQAAHTGQKTPGSHVPFPPFSRPAVAPVLVARRRVA